MASKQKSPASAMEIDRLAVQLAKDPHSKAFLPLAEEYCKAGMWQEAAGVLEDGLKLYPGFITAMVVLGRAYDQLGQVIKAKAILEEAVKLSPENLRAHRTLIKIYMTQGMTDGALKSCDVILALNPRDEEALSVQAKLGRSATDAAGLLTKPAAPKSARPAGSPSGSESVLPDDVKEHGETGSISPNSSETEARTISSVAAADAVMEGMPQTHDEKSSQQVASESSQDATASSTPFSLHAATIARLESWLRSIQQARRDRAAS